MGSRPFPEIPCVICKEPVNLQADLWAGRRRQGRSRGLLRPADYFIVSRRDVGQQLSVSTNSADVRRQQLL
jgi:hypothetical protein